METDELERSKQVEGAMAQAGVAPFDSHQDDYFAFDEKKQVFLPDGVSWVEIQVLNEGERKKYLNKVNRDIRFSKQSGDAIMSLKSGDEKHALLEAAIVGWNLVRNGKPVTFSKGSPGSELSQFLERANPKIIDLIEKEVRKLNPWLLAEMSLEDLLKERDQLNEMIEAKQKEEEGKDS